MSFANSIHFGAEIAKCKYVRGYRFSRLIIIIIVGRAYGAADARRSSRSGCVRRHTSRARSFDRSERRKVTDIKYKRNIRTASEWVSVDAMK